MSTTHVTTSRNAGRKSAITMAPPAQPASQSGVIAAMAAQPAQHQPIDAEVKRLMIAEAAYYCAERRGFAAGGELQDWLEAEAQLKATLGE
jgi:hypothetical protein